MSPDATQMLLATRGGDRAAAEKLLPLVYDELRARAAALLTRERPDHTLQPTALVHEAFLRLVDQTRVDGQDRVRFFAVASRAMRRVLIDHARKHRAAKRGGNLARITLDEAVAVSAQSDVDTLDLEAALTRLTSLNERQGCVVELRFFAGLTVEEVAEVLGVSPKTIELDWRMARAWLHRELTKEDST